MNNLKMHGSQRRRLGLVLLAALDVLPRAASAQSRDPEHYQLLLRDKVQVKGDAHIGGNIGVTSPRGDLAVGHDSTVADGRELVAYKVNVRARSRAFDVFGNILRLGHDSVVAGTITQPVSAPVYDPEPLIVPDPFDPANFPPAFPITCGGP